MEELAQDVFEPRKHQLEQIAFKYAETIELPNNYTHLLNLFIQFDTNLNLSKQRRGTGAVSFDRLQTMIQNSLGKDFKMNHLQ